MDKEKWFELFEECHAMFGGNRTRLIIGKTDDYWGKLEICGTPVDNQLKKMKQLIPFCEENNLRMEFDKYGEIVLREYYGESDND